MATEQEAGRQAEQKPKCGTALVYLSTLEMVRVIALHRGEPIPKVMEELLTTTNTVRQEYRKVLGHLNELGGEC